MRSCVEDGQDRSKTQRMPELINHINSGIPFINHLSLNSNILCIAGTALVLSGALVLFNNKTEEYNSLLSKAQKQADEKKPDENSSDSTSKTSSVYRPSTSTPKNTASPIVTETPLPEATSATKLPISCETQKPSGTVKVIVDHLYLRVNPYVPADGNYGYSAKWKDYSYYETTTTEHFKWYKVSACDDIWLADPLDNPGSYLEISSATN